MRNFRLVKVSIVIIAFSVLLGCRVKLISGYEETILETVTQMQKDFNVNAAKIDRAIGTNDNQKDQQYKNFEEYYVLMNANLYSLNSYKLSLDKKGKITVDQLEKLTTDLKVFEERHKSPGFNDGSNAAFGTLIRSINNDFTGIIFLQKELKPTE